MRTYIVIPSRKIFVAIGKLKDRAGAIREKVCSNVCMNSRRSQRIEDLCAPDSALRSSAIEAANDINISTYYCCAMQGAGGR